MPLPPLTQAQADRELFAWRPDDPNVRWLEQVLDNAAGWRSARDLIALSGGRLHDRAVRGLASASEQVLSGQRGYKHLRHATAEEVHHAAAWLESQAAKMSARACALRRNAHRLLG